MLYDPKWNGELTVLGFVEWLKKQDPNESYSYVDPRRCAICRYMKEELGFKNPCISPHLGYGEDGDKRKKYDVILDQIASCGNVETETYGTALARAKVFLGDYRC